MQSALQGGMQAIQEGASRVVDSIKTTLSPGQEFAALRDDEEQLGDNPTYLRRPHGSVTFGRGLTVSESPPVRYAPRRHQSGDLAARLQKTTDVTSIRFASPVMPAATCGRRRSTGSNVMKSRTRGRTVSSSPALDELLARPIHADPRGPAVDEGFDEMPVVGIEPARDSVPEIEFNPHGDLGELADLSALYDEVGAPVNAVEEEQQEEVEEAVGIEPESLVGELTKIPTEQLVAVIRRVIDLRPDVAASL